MISFRPAIGDPVYEHPDEATPEVSVSVDGLNLSDGLEPHPRTVVSLDACESPESGSREQALLQTLRRMVDSLAVLQSEATLVLGQDGHQGEFASEVSGLGSLPVATLMRCPTTPLFSAASQSMQSESGTSGFQSQPTLTEGRRQALQKAIDWTSENSNSGMKKTQSQISPTQLGPRSRSVHIGRRCWLAYTERISLCLIFLNTIYLGVELEVGLRNAATDPTREVESPGWLDFLDIFFTSAFTLELMIKMCLLRKDFFKGEFWRWNVFDLLLVLSSLLEKATVAINASFLRCFRVFRAIRAARMLRSVGFVNQLRFLVASVITSIGSLMWSLLLLAMITYMFALFIMQGTLGTFPYSDRDHDPKDIENHRKLIKHYGTVGQSLLTLFKSISGGIDWSEVAEPLREIDDIYYICFVLFIVIVIFGVLNIVTATFVMDAKGIAKVDKALVVQQELAEKKRAGLALKEFLTHNSEHPERIRRRDLQSSCSNDTASAMLKLLDIDARGVLGFFDVMDLQGRGYVDTEIFIDGLLRMKGNATCVDMATHHHEIMKLYRQTQGYLRRLDARVQQLQQSSAVVGWQGLPLNRL